MVREKPDLGPLAQALADYLESSLRDKETRTAALADVARKLLADNDYQFGKAQQPQLSSIAGSLPTRDPEQEVPAIRPLHA
jgi:hypothetical protein